jgi:hypothetical protein
MSGDMEREFDELDPSKVMRVVLFKAENGVESTAEISVPGPYHPEILEDLCRKALITLGGIFSEEDTAEQLAEMFGEDPAP